MHERWLRDEIKDRSHIPHSLKVFDENIEVAVRRAKDGEVTPWDLIESQWRARIIGWKKNPVHWQDNMWGPPPDQAGCRAPSSLLNELVMEAKAKKNEQMNVSLKKNSSQASVTA